MPDGVDVVSQLTGMSKCLVAAVVGDESITNLEIEDAIAFLSADNPLIVELIGRLLAKTKTPTEVKQVIGFCRSRMEHLLPLVTQPN